MATFNFTTGPATLPDVGTLYYNGCTFGPLFETSVSCAFIQDEAKRTTKWIEYTITVDGYVTLTDGEPNVETTLATLMRLLSVPAGALFYTGRSIKLEINTGGGSTDVAWGPVPEILDITPMGAGGSAKIKWTVKTRIPAHFSGPRHPVLQFNYETTVTYDEAGYSSMRIAGTTEIPLTRRTVNNRTVPSTVDDFRNRFPGRLLATIDLTRFRVVTRNFTVSRDKRTLTFDVQTEELPWMAMPPDCTIARGTFTFRPAKAGIGLAMWLCTLTCTYTVPREDHAGRIIPRNVAWWAFLALLRIRMAQGPLHGYIPPPQSSPSIAFTQLAVVLTPNSPGLIAGASTIDAWREILRRRAIAAARAPNVFLIDLNGSEGVHLDSKTTTFSATWRLVTTFDRILVASGLWKKQEDQNANQWATSVRNISGYSSWLLNRLDASQDAIVDFGY